MPAERPTVAVLGFPGESAPPGLDRVAELADTRVASSLPELKRALPAAEVLLVLDFRTNVLRDAWPTAERLRWVHAASAGVDNVMFPELRDSDVTLTNARGVFDAPVAEWVLAAVLLFSKDLLTTIELQRQRTWRHRESHRVAGKRVVVIGAGGIGRTTARLLRAVGMSATVVARAARPDDEFGRILGTGDLDGVLPDAEVVVLAAPLTDETRGLLDAGRLGRLRPGALLVNVGRGELVDEPALVEVLRSGRLGGAALDVFAEEPLPPESPLWTLPNVLVSPHMSGDFAGWRTALADQFADNLRRWIAGEPLDGVVDKHAGYATTGVEPR